MLRQRMRFMREQYYILSIPPVDFPPIPNLMTYEVERDKIVRREQGSPFAEVLLIDMVSTALAG